MSAHIERFAPSPTGYLHLGHAYSALVGWRAAEAAGGTFLLRMDDVDRSRCRPGYIQSIYDDLAWLDLSWPKEVMFQAAEAPRHLAVIEELGARGLVYPCVCTRAEIEAAAGAPQEGAEHGPAYPGTCRGREIEVVHKPHAIRLDMRKAVAELGGALAVAGLSFQEIGAGPGGETGAVCLNPESLIEEIGDIVLVRKDGAVSYHLSVVLDDAHQGVTHVTRGQDLFSSTPIHRLLQALCGCPVPTYRHHDLIRDENGKRLAKRDDARSLKTLREHGATRADILTLLNIDG